MPHGMMSASCLQLVLYLLDTRGKAALRSHKFKNPDRILSNKTGVMCTHLTRRFSSRHKCALCPMRLAGHIAELPASSALLARCSIARPLMSKHHSQANHLAKAPPAMPLASSCMLLSSYLFYVAYHCYMEKRHKGPALLLSCALLLLLYHCYIKTGHNDSP